MRSRLNKYTREKPNYLHVALFFSVTDEDRDMKENVVKEFSEEFDNTLFILLTEVFSPNAQTKFVDALAQANVSRAHHNNEDSAQFENTAKEYIAKWQNRINGGTYSLFFQGNYYSEGVFSNIYQVINKKFSVKLFPSGMESIRVLQNESMTYFANKNFKALSLQMLQKRTRDELLNFGGSVRPTRFLFTEGENNLITDNCELTEAALAGNSWVSTICKEVDNLIAAAKKKYADRFSLNEVLAPLMRAPYGLFANAPCYAILGFALRKHKEDLFNPSTSQPVGDEKLNEMIEILLKMWDNGTNENTNKLSLRFGSVEERNLTSILGEVFNLNDVKGVSLSDLKSLNYAKWCITEYCKQIAKYPLWSLLYCSQIKSKDNCKKSLEDLITLFNQDSYPLAKIKELYREIKNNQIDLYKLLSDQKNYEEGFCEFIKSIEGVDIQEDWWSELEEELDTMQSEIAFRKEEDVKNRVLQFYISKLTPKKETSSETSRKIDYGETNEDTSVVIEARVQMPDDNTLRRAKNLVKAQTMPSMMWQKIVLDMLDDHPEVSKFLIDYLDN